MLAYGAQPWYRELPPNKAARYPSARPQDGGGGGTPHPEARATHTRPGERRGNPNQAAHNTAPSQGEEEVGGTPKLQRAHITHCMKEREREGNPDPDEEGGAPPKQRALPALGMHLREGGGLPDQEGEGGAPPGNVRSLIMACKRGTGK